MRIFTEEQAALLDAQTARFNVVAYSRVVESQAKQLVVLTKMVEELQQHIFNQEQQWFGTKQALNDLRAMHFGRSSERRMTPEGPLFSYSQESSSGESDQGSSSEKIESSTSGTEGKQKPKHKNRGRKAQPKLPVVEVRYTLSEQEIMEQGLTAMGGQFETSELITFHPPRVEIERSLRQKYRQDLGDGDSTIITAPGPLKLLEKCRYSIDFAIQAGLEKYESHLPLSRQVKRFSELGLSVSEQTLYDLLEQVAWNLKPHVVDPIARFILSGKVLQADDTYWRNLDDKKKLYLWAIANNEAASFLIYDSRSQKVVQHFLDGYKGIVLSDGHGSFRVIEGRLVWANDWAHARRKFVKAETSYPLEAQWFIEQIRLLSLIERRIKGLAPEEILRIRQAESKPIVDEIFSRLEALNGVVMPKGKLGKAVTYCLKLAAGLRVFLENPEVPMTTNLVERILRAPVVGRKVHYGSRTIESARIAAIWYTIIATCQLNGVSPGTYIKYALTQVLTGKSPVMPWEFKNVG